VAIEGSDKDRLVVVGEGVDSANLTRSLRKKLYYTEILKVEEVKKKPPESCCPTLSMCRQYPPFPMYCEPIVQAPYSSIDGCVLMLSIYEYEVLFFLFVSLNLFVAVFCSGHSRVLFLWCFVTFVARLLVVVAI
jgi:hypothetical protein